MRERHSDGVKRASGGSCAPEFVVKRAPAHAGGLRMSERLAFVFMFSLMAAFVVGLTVLAAKSGANPLIGRSVPASSTLPAKAHDAVNSGKPGSDVGNPCRRHRRELCAAAGGS